MHNFTPYAALLGGALIGLSALLFLLLNGKIAGVSGIMHGLIPPKQGDIVWRIMFIVGIILGGFIYHTKLPNHFIMRAHFPIVLLIIAGFLVGFGTRLGGGCTSGHGVCGVGRLSIRSLIATVIFLIVAMITTYIVRHVFGVF